MINKTTKLLQDLVEGQGQIQKDLRRIEGKIDDTKEILTKRIDKLGL